MDKPKELRSAVFQPGLTVRKAALNHPHLLGGLVGGGHPPLVVPGEGGDALHLVYAVARQNLLCLPGGILSARPNQDGDSGTQHIGDGAQPPEGAEHRQRPAGNDAGRLEKKEVAPAGGLFGHAGAVALAVLLPLAHRLIPGHTGEKVVLGLLTGPLQGLLCPLQFLLAQTDLGLQGL